MYIFLPKLLVQALRKRAHREFGRRKRGRSRVPTQSGGCAGEEQRAALATLVERLALECGDRLARERECRFDVRVRHTVDFILSDLQERLPDGEARVEERDAYVGVRPARTHSAESSLDFFVVIVSYWERRRLNESVRDGVPAHVRTYFCFPCLKLSCELVEAVALSRDQSDIVSRPGKETAGVP